MPSSERDPKSLGEWMELDYFKRPRRLRRLRRLITWSVLGLTALFLAFTFWPPRPVLYQAGPLSTAHHMFTADCAQCHEQSFQTVQRLWPGHANVRSVSDQACKQCHDGPVHNVQQVQEQHCATCHREHRGRPVLAAVADSFCTDCHANLQRKDGKPPEFLSVRSFATNHPEFFLWRDQQPVDPGRLHFNHRVHLKEEGVLSADGKKVRLECISCHQPEANYRPMQPIKYERHCAQCHPLSVQLADHGNSPDAREAADQFRRQSAPHQKPAEVRAVLRDRLTRLVQSSPSVLDTSKAGPSERLFPGKHERPGDVKPAEWTWVEQQLLRSEHVLFNGAGGCMYCHEKKDTAGPAKPDSLPEFWPTNIPERWLPHSRFDHQSHQMLRCTECHPATTSQKTSDVLLPRIDNCRQCHNPQVGARSACIDCHSYHVRSQKGAWVGTRTIQDCLRNAVRGARKAE